MGTFESFIGNFDGQKWHPDIYTTLFGVIRNDRAALPAIAHWILDTPGRHFNLLADLIPHLTEAEFAELTAYALSRIEAGEASDDIRECVERACLQIPGALREHLSVLRELDECRLTAFAWRTADEREVRALEAALLGDEASIEDWERLLETGDAAAIHRVYSRLEADRADLDAAALSRDVEMHEGQPRTLTLGPCHHLHFDSETPSYDGWLREIRELHPTRRLRSESDVTGLAGGQTSEPCGLCGGPVAILVQLREAPADFNVSARPLVLGACIPCLTDYGGAQVEAFYHTHETGEPRTLKVGNERREPEFREPPLPVSRLRASRTPPRWEMQDYGLANSRESLHRLGGRPSWVQEAEYPDCPKCSRRMPFLAQFTAELPAAPGQTSGLNEDGIAYFFWCDDCQVSAVLQQYT